MRLSCMTDEQLNAIKKFVVDYPEKESYTMRDLCTLFNVNEKTARLWRANRVIKVMTIGATSYILRQEMLDFIERQKTDGI